MTILDLLSPLFEIAHGLRLAFLPTLLALLASPSLLLQPRKIGQVFFGASWASWGRGMDVDFGEMKRDLIMSRARGVVVDIGAGYGLAIKYLDLGRVERYIAIEPNEGMHAGIREEAVKAGLGLEKVTILSCGIEDLAKISEHVGIGGVNTMISLMALCSIPNPSTTIPAFLRFLAPGGQLLFLEHVQSEGTLEQWVQGAWNPVWRRFFDGCRLGRDTVGIVSGSGEWGEERVWGLEGEGKGTLFPHRFGIYTRTR